MRIAIKERGRVLAQKRLAQEELLAALTERHHHPSWRSRWRLQRAEDSYQNAVAAAKEWE